jgi:hypothetical protein
VPGAGCRHLVVRAAGRALDAIIAERGKPAACVSDNGTELTSTAILRRSQETGVDWHYIAYGKPQCHYREFQWLPARRATSY